MATMTDPSTGKQVTVQDYQIPILKQRGFTSVSSSPSTSSTPNIPASSNSNNSSQSPVSTSNANYGIPSGGSVPPLNPTLNSNQKAYFDKTGGFQSYYDNQNNIFGQDIASGNYAHAGKIQADLGRFNVQPNVPKPQGIIPEQPKILTADDIKAMIEKENSALIAQRQNAANNYINGLKGNFNQNLQQIHGDQTLQDAQFNRQNNPFSGHTDYSRGVLNRQREITNQNLTADLNNRIAGAQQGVLDYSQTLAAAEPQQIQQQMEQARQLAIQEAALTGRYNNAPTLAAQNQNFNQGISEADITGQYHGNPTFAATQAAIKNGLSQQQIDLSAKQFAEQKGYNWAKLSQDQKQFMADLAIRQQNADTSAGDLQYKKDHANDSKNVDPLSYTSKLNDLYVAKDPITGETKVSNPTSLRSAIISLNLPDADTDKLLSYYGLPINQ